MALATGTAVIDILRPRAGPVHKLHWGPAKVAAVVAVLVIVAGASNQVSSEHQVAVFGHLLIGASSDSMAPAVTSGDIAVEEAIGPSESDHLQAGQIISFRARPGSAVVVTSRIVARTETEDGVAYITKADANDAQDPAVAHPAEVIGVYQSTIPYGWYLLDSLHRPLPLVLTLVLLLVWLLSEPRRRRGREAAEAAHQELAFEDR